MVKVRKRDGSLQDFDKNKIINAIMKAGELPTRTINTIVKHIEDIVCDKKEITINEIQRFVENELVKTKNCDVARSYISYRYLHDLARDKYREMLDVIADKVFAKNVKNQNANVDEKSFGGRKGEMSSAILKDYALNYCMSEQSKMNHLNNEIYIHDLDSYALGLHNCFKRDTKFITNLGIKSFSDCYDGEKLKVLSSDGSWNDATVHMYGRQPMQTVELSRCGVTISFDCTKNHRWLLSDGTVTENISLGDRLIPLVDSTDYSIKTDRDSEMFCLGFIIGDGCDHGDYIQARLCNDKLKYADVFSNAHYKPSVIKGTQDLIYYKKADYKKQEFLTNKNWRLLSFRDKVSLFNGYISADGSKTTDTKYVWTSDERILLMIKEISALAGYHIFKIRRIVNSTNYKENRELFEVVFTTKYSNNSTWVVTKIKNKRNKDYEAWCVDEPKTHSFTLFGGIVTGNCLSLPVDDLLKNGFNTRQTDVRPAQSVNTAFQLLAVLFQLQSLNQFGGVAATHIDWTMVPYVRKSFYKHYKDGMKYIDNVGINENFSVVDTPIDSEIYKKNSNVWKYAYDMLVKEVYQAVEGMYHNLNTLGRLNSDIKNIAI